MAGGVYSGTSRAVNMKRLYPVIVCVVSVGLLLPAVAAPVPHFFGKQTRLAPGSTAVIPFRLDEPANQDQEWQPEIDPAGSLEILMPAKVLEGETTGFLRVRALAPGRTQLRVGDGTPLAVRVPKHKPQGPEPVLVSPMPDAYAWGKIAVGAEWNHDGERPLLLLLPDGSTIAPERTSDPDQGLPRRYLFTLDTERLAPGHVELRPVVGSADGPAGAALRLQVVRAGDEVVQGECEASLEGERPKARGGKHPPSRTSETASGGALVSCASSRPEWCLPFEARKPGLYQVMSRARGTLAGGDYPSMALLVDEERDPLTGTRLAGPGWHRLPVGRPVPLEPGPHTLALRFSNDFHAKDLADRNLELDAYEVLRVADLPSEAARGMVDGKHPDRPLAVSFAAPLHDRRAAGVVNVRARCWWDTKLDDRLPAVTLRVNGQPLTTQYATSPVFELWPGNLRAGGNTLQLEARHPSFGRVVSARQTIHRPGEGDARVVHRFSVRDSRWGDSMAPHLKQDDQGRYDERTAVVFSNSQLIVRIPDRIEGRFDILLDGRGEPFEGPPAVETTLLAEDTDPSPARTDIKSSWGHHALCSVDLPPGPKRIRISFVNDHYAKDQGDRNLHVRGLLLKSRLEGANETAPVVQVVYPPPDAVMHNADVVVAEVADNRGSPRCDLVVDGETRRFDVRPHDGLGPVVLPLLLRGMAPGPHEIAVEARDDKGNRTRSDVVRVHVPDQPPEELGTYARAVRLLDRFAFGPEQRELAALLTLGEESWLRSRLRRPYRAGGDLAAVEFVAGSYYDEANQSHVQQRALNHALLTDNPVRARFVLWAQNHFSTYIRKTGALPKWEEHEMFSRLGVAPFPRLLAASATSPAMLVYLDQNTSFAGRLNENYAREILELHTLGVDAGYTQEDVTGLAGLLTGWTVSDTFPRRGSPRVMAKTYRFDPALNEPGAVTVYGMAFPAAEAAGARDRIQVAMEMLAGHPDTASYVCGKLAEHYLGASAPDRLTRELENTFLGTSGDLTAVLMTLARHPDFQDPRLPSKFTTPLDYSVRLARIARYGNSWRIREYLSGAGMGLFERVTPDGYPEEPSAYADTNGLLQRWRLARDLEGSLANTLPPATRARLDQGDDEAAQEVIDLASLQITGRLLEPASNRAALDVLAATTGRSDQRIRSMIGFVGQLPEANLR